MSRDLRVRENYAYILAKNVLARGISQNKAPEVGVCLACLSNKGKANKTGMEYMEREGQRDYMGTWLVGAGVTNFFL